MFLHICRIGLHIATASFLLLVWMGTERPVCLWGNSSRRSTLGNKKKSERKKAFYFLKLQPLSTATAGGQPPACLPLQHYTLLLKSPDTAQWASHLPCYSDNSLELPICLSGMTTKSLASASAGRWKWALMEPRFGFKNLQTNVFAPLLPVAGGTKTSPQPPQLSHIQCPPMLLM